MSPSAAQKKRRPEAPLLFGGRFEPLAAAGALFEPGHLGPIPASIGPVRGCGLGLRGPLTLRRPLTLSRSLILRRPLALRGPLLAAGRMPALRLTALGLAAATATARAVLGIGIGVARLAMPLMPAGMGGGTAALRLLATRLGSLACD